ncbi:MAG: hypothetical protein WC674_07350 [Candidatus Krumholzibacteriia bacterium]
MKMRRFLPFMLAIAIMLSAPPAPFSAAAQQPPPFKDDPKIPDTMAVLSNYGGGADPVGKKIQNLVGRK